jgi:NAD(P)-dependent dehydrogenase (short-subunit alcohol dehydrogenase family)
MSVGGSAESAVIGLTSSIAIAPGVATPMTAVAIDGTPADIDAVAADHRRGYGRGGDVGDIANAALCLAGDESKFVNGHTLVSMPGAPSTVGRFV